MRRFAGLAVLLLAMAATQAVWAQGQSATGLTGPPNFTAINPAGSSSGAMQGIGFNPMNFFHKIGSMFSWPPQTGNSNAGTIIGGPNPFPTTPFPFSTKGPFPTTSQLPTMELHTSFHP